MFEESPEKYLEDHFLHIIRRAVDHSLETRFSLRFSFFSPEDLIRIPNMITKWILPAVWMHPQRVYKSSTKPSHGNIPAISQQHRIRHVSGWTPDDVELLSLWHTFGGCPKLRGN